MATTTRKAPAKATTKAPAKATAKKSTAKAPAKATAKKAPAKATAKKAPVKVTPRKAPVNGIAHPGAEWKALLEKSGMNQTQLKGLTGVPGPRMNAVLNERANPTAEITVRFARALGLDEKKLWTKVSAHLLAEAQATVK